MTIDINKKYKTRDGRDVRILCTDRDDPDYPVVALVTGRGHSRSITCTYTAEGEYSIVGDSSMDLVEVPKEYFRTLSLPKVTGFHIEDGRGTQHPVFELGAYVAESKAGLRAMFPLGVNYTHVAVLGDRGQIIRIEEF